MTGQADSGSVSEHRLPDIKACLRKVGAGAHRSQGLSTEEARFAANAILDESATPAQTGALLIALRLKEETAEELAGFSLAVRDHMCSVPTPPGPLVDCAGAYDGRVRTLPVGPAAALVAARAGVAALYHGVSGLGRAGINPGQTLRALGPGSSLVTYVDQADYCPALARLNLLRNDLGLRTAFNTAEKLACPGDRSEAQRTLLVGVFHGPYRSRVAETAAQLGIAHALVIQGSEGSDDLSVTRDSRVCEVRNGQVSEWTVDLEALGLERRAPAVMECSGLGQIVRRLTAALTGEPGPDRDAIILNAALRLYLAGRVASLKDGLIYARDLLASGSAPQPSTR